ncbi:MAG TPA: formyltransferase family protein [Gaiellaceae bacterium]|nr:formyltransferase family protein [Gaiellaceae bacterium]
MGFRVVVISAVLPVAEPLIAHLGEVGHDPVAWLLPRRRDDRPPPPWGEVTDAAAPDGVSVLFARDKEAVAPLLRGLEPDVVLCWGFSWKLPPEALEVPRLGAVNHHPGLLPRHRGPIPMAWAMRDGDAEFGLTWHRMDAEYDTGPILAQATVPIEDDDSTIEVIGPKLIEAALALLPRVFERLEAGDPGDPQPTDGVTWAGLFEEDYATVDWNWPARAIHNQVRAWHLAFGLSPVDGPIAELDGERVKLLRTSLTDPGDGARAVACGDGQIWIVESEPASSNY